MRSVDPVTGKLVQEYPEHAPAEVLARLERAVAAQREWQEAGDGLRAEPMRRTADVLDRRRDELARLMAREMGKPLREGRAELEKCAWVCRYYAEHAAGFLADEPVETEARKSYVVHRPLGVILAIMPWNFPFWQAFRFAAPALMAGNGALLKHAPNVTGCSMAIEDAFVEAGMPAGLFASLVVDVAAVPHLIEDPRVAGVTLTGSTRAGRAVGSQAGRALKKTVLELGGSDPYVVLADADLDATVETCVTSRLINAGQSCIAAKRFVVVAEVCDAFVERFLARFRKVRTGDPLDEETELGPLARRDLRDELHRQVGESVERGATLLLGGEVPPGPGAFYPPTVLTEVAPGMPAHDEELFGPVAAILPVSDEAEAIRVANDTRYGLGAAVFTRDLERGERIASQELHAGCAYVNAFVRSDPRLPFGGIRDSGYGRELSHHGLREFVNAKTVVVA